MRSDLYKKEKFKINFQNQPHLNHPNMRNMHLNKNYKAARKIQTKFRQKLAKQKVAKVRINKAKATAAATKIQTIFRQKLTNPNVSISRQLKKMSLK